LRRLPTPKVDLKKLNLSIQDVENILDLLALLAKKHSIYFLLRPNLIDENDNIICECAFAANSDIRDTLGLRHVQEGGLRKDIQSKGMINGFCG